MMKKGLFCKPIVLISIISLCGYAGAATMAYWDFGPDASGYTTDVTLGVVSGVPTLGIMGGEPDSNGKDGVSGQAAAWNDVSVASPDIDAYLEITIDTTGWSNISISWDYKSENDTEENDLGPESLDFSYYTSGMADWEKFVGNDALIRDGQWHPYSLNLSTVDIIENQSILQFLADDFKNDSGGKFWVDNVTITGTPIPEPATMLLFGLGGVLLRRSKR